MTQENERKLFDTMNTTISVPPLQQTMGQFGSPYVLPAQRILVPGGAEFVFRPQFPSFSSSANTSQRYVQVWNKS